MTFAKLHSPSRSLFSHYQCTTEASKLSVDNTINLKASARIFSTFSTKLFISKRGTTWKALRNIEADREKDPNWGSTYQLTSCALTANIWLSIERKAQVWLTTLMRCLSFYMSQQAKALDRAGTHKWSAAVITVINYTCALAVMKCESVCTQKACSGSYNKPKQW